MTTVTVNYKGLELKCYGFYSEKEKEEMYDSNMSGSKEIPAEFDLKEVYVGNTDMIDIFDLLYSNDLDDIESLCIEELENR